MATRVRIVHRIPRHRTAAVLACAAAFCAAACGGGSPARPTPVSGAAPGPIAAPSEPDPIAPPKPVPPPVTLVATRFLAFGDSMTSGETALSANLSLVPTTPYSTTLQQQLSARYTAQNISVTNAGRSGEWAQDGEARLPRELAAQPPQVLLLLEGVNDLNALGRRGLRPALDSLENMTHRAVGQGVRVFLAGLPPQRSGAPRALSAALVPEFNTELRKIAADERAVFVDVNAAFGADDTLLSADGLHPTAQGYTVMARAFFEAIRATLEAPALSATAVRGAARELPDAGSPALHR